MQRRRKALTKRREKEHDSLWHPLEGVGHSKTTGEEKLLSTIWGIGGKLEGEGSANLSLVDRRRGCEKLAVLCLSFSRKGRRGALLMRGRATRTNSGGCNGAGRGEKAEPSPNKLGPFPWEEPRGGV